MDDANGHYRVSIDRLSLPEFPSCSQQHAHASSIIATSPFEFLHTNTVKIGHLRVQQKLTTYGTYFVKIKESVGNRDLTILLRAKHLILTVKQLPTMSRPIDKFLQMRCIMQGHQRAFDALTPYLHTTAEP